MSEISWNYATVVGNDPDTLAPIFYKEGAAPGTVTLPTGAAASELAEGSLVRYTTGEDANKVMTYSREEDSWSLFVDFNS